MELYHAISVIVPLVIVVVLPYILQTQDYRTEKKYRKLLYVACGLFFISWYLPSPLIQGQDTSFVTHFVGGGMFTGLTWIYLVKSYGWRAHWLLEAFSLFALVSALGSINEIFELFANFVGIANITITETNWDIVANTLGAACIFVAYVIISLYDSRRR